MSTLLVAAIQDVDGSGSNLVAAETLPEYDQTIFDAKVAARAVVVG